MEVGQILLSSIKKDFCTAKIESPPFWMKTMKPIRSGMANLFIVEQ
jgi:hypothetical protein